MDSLQEIYMQDLPTGSPVLNSLKKQLKQVRVPPLSTLHHAPRTHHAIAGDSRLGGKLWATNGSTDGLSTLRGACCHAVGRGRGTGHATPVPRPATRTAVRFGGVHLRRRRPQELGGEGRGSERAGR